MQSQTLADLRTRFYDLFDLGASQYIGTTEATRYINEAGRWLHNWIVGSNEWYLWRVAQITVSSGQSDYALPNDFYKDLKVFGVYNQVASTTTPYYWPLRRVMPQEFRGGPSTVFRYPNYAPFGYMILGQTLRITPIPVQSNFNVEMWYAPHYAELLNDSDLVDMSVAPGWDEYIVNMAVIKAKLKEEADVSDLVRRNEEIKQNITDEMMGRDLGMPERMTDATSNLGPDGMWWPGGGFW